MVRHAHQALATAKVQPDAVAMVRETTDRAAIETVACVCASAHATDVAFKISSIHLAVVRCAAHVANTDHTALATMMSEGDFVWAGLVYSEREGSETAGLIETFHVSELDRLVARLDELRAVFSDTR